jgi:hypothetical protein
LPTTLTVLVFIGCPYFTDASKSAPQLWILAGRPNVSDARALRVGNAAWLTDLAKRVGCT